MDNRFLELSAHLWRGGAFSYLWSPDNDNGKLSFWFSVEEPRVIDSSWNRYNVYFSVHPSKVMKTIYARPLLDDIAAINCLFAEFDLAPGQEPNHLLASINQMDTPPSVIIYSGGGYHCYWLLENTFKLTDEQSRQIAIDTQYAWVDYVGSDQGAKDITRVLRVPGTYNRKSEYKPDYPQVEIVKFDMELLYTFEDLEREVQPIIDATAQKRVSVTAAPTVPVDLDDQTIIEQMHKRDAVALALWNGDMSDYGDDHSSADQALCNRLAFWLGRDADRIDRVFRRSGLYRQKWIDRQDYRERTIDRAIASCQNTYTPASNNGVLIGDPASVVGNVIGASVNGHSKPKAKPQAGPLPSINGTPPPQVPPANPQPQTQGSGNQNYLLDEGAHDEGNAQAVMKRYNGSFLFNDSLGWLHHTGTHWKSPGAEASVERSITETLQARIMAATFSGQAQQYGGLIKKCIPNSAAIQGAKNQLKSAAYVDHEIFDTDLDLLNCPNGVVDLRTGNIQPHATSQRFTHCTAVDYKPGADYVEWVNWLVDTTSAETAEWLQIAVGYSLTGHTREEILFYLYGPPRSGKGTFIESIIALLGKPMSSVISFSTLTAPQEADTQNFNLAPLHSSRFVSAEESNPHERFNEAKVKLITGGNDIQCAFKRKTPFTYRPKYKIWLASNNPVNADPDDDAVWGRIRVIEFPHSKLGKEDKALKERMKSTEMLESVLCWAIEGAIKWYQLGSSGLKELDSAAKAKTSQRNDLDSIQAWLDECCNTTDPTSFSGNSALRSSYENWCKDNGHTPKKQKGFTQSLVKKGFNNNDGKTYRHVDVFGNPKSSRGFFGIQV